MHSTRGNASKKDNRIVIDIDAIFADDLRKPPENSFTIFDLVSRGMSMPAARSAIQRKIDSGQIKKFGLYNKKMYYFPE
jgi:hypothetical protein